MSAGDRTLQVILYGEVVGQLAQTPGGQHVFTYQGGSGPTPLSLSMPRRSGSYPHRSAEPFLEGLLPDRESVRAALGETFGVSGRNPFALLENMGVECAGAVQFCRDDQVDDVLASRGSIESVDAVGVGDRLRDLKARPSSWTVDRERWSLGGAQSKFAVVRTNAGWGVATGAQATTHIIKPGVNEFRDQALNEHICLSSARLLGLDAALTEYIEFDGEEALVVARYDRVVGPDGAISRIHQEDMCQATSTYPRDKYESEGGPRAARIASMLGEAGVEEDQPGNVNSFLDGLIFNYLVGAPDAHAKNYSVLLLDDIVRLAPLYDVASGLPYELRGHEGLGGAAMAIGGEKRFGQVARKHWERLAVEIGYPAEKLISRVADLAGKVPDALAAAMDDEAIAVRSRELRSRMLDGAADLCKTTVAQIESPGGSRGAWNRPPSPGLRRVSRGVPAGGEFTAAVRGEPDVTLD